MCATTTARSASPRPANTSKPRRAAAEARSTENGRQHQRHYSRLQRRRLPATLPAVSGRADDLRSPGDRPRGRWFHRCKRRALRRVCRAPRKRARLPQSPTAVFRPRATMASKGPRATTICSSTATTFCAPTPASCWRRRRRKSAPISSSFRKWRSMTTRCASCPRSFRPGASSETKRCFAALCGRSGGLVEVVSDKLIRAELFKGLRFPRGHEV